MGQDLNANKPEESVSSASSSQLDVSGSHETSNSQHEAESPAPPVALEMQAYEQDHLLNSDGNVNNVEGNQGYFASNSHVYLSIFSSITSQILVIISKQPLCLRLQPEFR